MSPARRTSGKKVSFCHIVPTDADLEQESARRRVFSRLVGWPVTAAADRAVLPFPSHEVDPYRGLAPHIGVTSVRARALYAMANGSARVVVASAAALLPRVTPPARLRRASIELFPGHDIAPMDLVELLVDAGFSREDPADEHGEFAVRGGIVDIFPAGESLPVRLEFAGDTIESMRAYDPSTQRSTAAVDRVTVIPLQDVLGDDRNATLFDYLSAANDVQLVVSERDEVNAHAAKLLDQMQRSYETITAADRSGGASRIAPPSALFANWDDVDTRLSLATTVSQLGLEDQVHIRCQPAVAFHGRVADWVADARRFRESGGTTLFVAATAGRAERTVELLKDTRSSPCRSSGAEERRYAAVLVAQGSVSEGFRLPDADFQIYSEADVFEEERALLNAAGLPRRRFCRIFAISRSATTSFTSITASASSSA